MNSFALENLFDWSLNLLLLSPYLEFSRLDFEDTPEFSLVSAGGLGPFAFRGLLFRESGLFLGVIDGLLAGWTITGGGPVLLWMLPRLPITFFELDSTSRLLYRSLMTVEMSTLLPLRQGGLLHDLEEVFPVHRLLELAAEEPALGALGQARLPRPRCP